MRPTLPLRLAAAAVALGALAGCATTPRPRGSVAAALGGGAIDRPLQVLLRAEVGDGERDGNLRLTLRLWRAGRFELRASDPFGRRLWTLAVADDDGLWSDAASGARCRIAADGRVRLGEVALPLRSRLLPVVLLGGLPVAVPDGAEDADGAPSGARVARFTDGEGQDWQVTFDAESRPAAWRLAASDGGSLAWERRGERQRLTATAPRLEIEWREVAREALTLAEPAWNAASERVPECGDEDLP